MSERAVDIDDEEQPERALSDIKEEKLEWLWYPYIPFEMVTNLEGEGNIGKSRLTRYIAARVTKGLTLPGQEEGGPPGNVLVVSFSEDPVPSVVKPQIRKMGGDQKRLFVIERPFTLDEDGVKLLSDVMKRRKPSLVILDPLSDYIPSRTNTYKDEEVRRMVMGPLTGLAKEHSCAILAIRHFTKGGGGGSVKYRGGGSVAFANVSRSTIACIEDPHDDHITVIGPTKANLVPKDNLVFRRFEIVKTEDGIGRLVWRGTSDKTLDQLEVERAKADRNPEREVEAKEWLLEQLAEGEVLMKELKERAEGKSFSWSTVERAKRNAPEVKSKGGFRGNPAVWFIDDEKH